MVQTLKCAARFTICHRTLKFSANIHLNWKSLSFLDFLKGVELAVKSIVKFPHLKPEVHRSREIIATELAD